MAIFSVSDFSSLIKQQIHTQETIEACLSKLQALIAIARDSDDVCGFADKTLHNYLWAIDDLVIEAFEANQLSLQNLLKQNIS